MLSIFLRYRLIIINEVYQVTPTRKTFRHITFDSFTISLSGVPMVFGSGRGKAFYRRGVKSERT
jgi:hypothetical protein